MASDMNDVAFDTIQLDPSACPECGGSGDSDPSNNNTPPCSACRGSGFRLTFSQLQAEQREWADRNFGTDRKTYWPVLGVSEEAGELAHAVLKMEQGIRGTKEDHLEAIKDAVGDITVYLADVCTQYGISFQEAIETTWNKVKQRDWTKNKKTGG